jgi:hypothetical protein
VINLVEEVRVLVEWDEGTHSLHYAEMMIFSAATGPFGMRNGSIGICKFVKAFVKSFNPVRENSPNQGGAMRVEPGHKSGSLSWVARQKN